jgi:hypothetical protein
VNFRIGQKVVCIWQYSRGMDDCPSIPQKGQVYTVRGFSDAPYRPDELAIYLEEVVNPPFDYSPGWDWTGEPSFMACRFRPVVERKTDISIFTEMLGPNKVKEFAALTAAHRDGKQ